MSGRVVVASLALLLAAACGTSSAQATSDPCALGPDESQPSPENLCGKTTPTAGSACNRCAGRCSFADGRLSADTSPPGGGVLKPTCGADGSVTEAGCTDHGWALSTSRDCWPAPAPRDAGGD